MEHLYFAYALIVLLLGAVSSVAAFLLFNEHTDADERQNGDDEG